VVTKCVVSELSDLLVGGRVEKIFQPEADEIIMNVRSKGQNLKLLLSASANYARVHVTGSSKENPSTPPVFCMLLRKHLSGGKIVNVTFHDFERLIAVHIESTNEMGDTSVKTLFTEIMGRHSNIILVNSENKIIDAIKHVDIEVSSLREVMPAREYLPPPSQDKTSPFQLDIGAFIDKAVFSSVMSMEKYLLENIKGFSPLLCREICFRAGVDGKTPCTDIPGYKYEDLKKVMSGLVSDIMGGSFSPCIIFDTSSKPVDFHCLIMEQYGKVKYLPSISTVLDEYYSQKDNIERLKQKKSDVLKVLNNNISRCNKKMALQQEKLRDVADRETLRLYGELITANIYSIPRNLKKVSLLNYYSEDGSYVEVPLDENLLPQDNAQRYFRRYTKAKSAYTYTSRQLEETLKELEYLESVLQMLENCYTLQEIDEIRQELIEQGYISSRKAGSSKKHSRQSEPLKFKSSDGLDIFVGRNNRQNDQLTLKTASTNDIWLHTRNIPGSHVIIKKLQHDIPDSTLLEAAVLAAYHSKARLSSNVPVDYTTVKNVKKPGGAKPGMVIYENFKTIIVTPDEAVVKKLGAKKQYNI